MSGKTPPISNRIKELVDYYGEGNNSKFAALIGTSEANIRNYINGTMPKFEIISNIATKFEINYEWLLTGKGGMHTKEQISYEKLVKHYETLETPLQFVETPEGPGKTRTELIQLLAQKEGTIPLVSTEAIGGFGNMNFVIKEQDIQSMYKVPDFTNINFMIRVKGSSMYPKYNSGDVVACRIIRESQFIQWNKVHVIATKEQGILIKRLKQGTTPKSLLAISDNDSYDPFEIPKNEITGIALVVGVIRLE